MVRTLANPPSLNAAATSAIFRLTPPTLTPRRNAAYLVMTRFQQAAQERRNGDVGFRHGTPGVRRQAVGRDQREFPRGAGHHQTRRAPAALQRELSLRAARARRAGI